MEGKELLKIVYEDEGTTKVLKGKIIKEEEFLYIIEALGTKANIVIGKRAIVKISSLEGDRYG